MPVDPRLVFSMNGQPAQVREANPFLLAGQPTAINPGNIISTILNNMAFGPGQVAPQGPDESGYAALMRRTAEGITRGPANALATIGDSYTNLIGQPFANAVFGTARDLVATPRQRDQRLTAQGHAQLSRAFSADYHKGAGGANAPTSYKDASWDGIEQQVAARLGNPILADMLRSVRTAGERSNSDQVSSAGARTVYQFTPETRQLFMDKYKLDPWSSPQNAALAAGMHLQESLQRNGGDPVAAFGEYIGGPNRANWGPQTADYIARTAGQLAGVAGMAFDPSYYQQALAANDQATRAALQPQTVAFDLPAAPEMPAPVLPAKTDFSKADAALEALRPQAPDEQTRRRVMRANVWQSIGQALAATPDGAGLGKVLAMVGGGALAGRGAGVDEWQKRMDVYEQKMDRFHQLVFQNETQKASVARSEAEEEARTLNTFGLQKWSAAMQQWSKFNDIRATEGGFIVTNLKDGKVTSTFTPNRGAVLAAGAARRAGIFGQMAGDQNTALRGAFSPLPGMITGMASTQWMRDQQMQSDPEANAGLPALGGMFAADIVQSGYLPQVLGEEQTAALMKQGQQYLLQSNPNLAASPKDYQEALNNWVVGQVTELMIKAAQSGDQALLDKFGTYGQIGSSIRTARQQAEAKTTIRQDSKGQQTRTLAFGGG